MPAKGYKFRRDNIIDVKFYKEFKEQHNIDIDYKTFKKIIITSNKKIADIIVDGNDGFRLPKGLGAITVSKYKSSKKHIDWQNSNKFNKRIYHLNLHTYGYNFSIRWFKHNVTKLALVGIYKFKASRKLRRSVVKRAKDTQGSVYFDWQYRDFYQATKLERYLLRRDKNGKNINT